MALKEFSVRNDEDLKDKLRIVTGYANSPDELPSDILDGIVNVAKMTVYSDTGSEEWYSDHGLGQVLLFTTAIHSVIRMENYSVDSWSIGDERIQVRNASGDEHAQLQQWNAMILKGLSASDEIESEINFTLTSNYHW